MHPSLEKENKIHYKKTCEKKLSPIRSTTKTIASSLRPSLMIKQKLYSDLAVTTLAKFERHFQSCE